MQKDHHKHIDKWTDAWKYRSFRNKAVTGLILLVALGIFFPFFFNLIEARKGIRLNDPLLSILPAVDVSIPIFLVLYSTIIFALYKCYKDPSVFIVLLWSYLIMNFFRIISIYLFPLAPPSGLIVIKDIITYLFYGNRFITKDLLFSGHTATLFLMFLSLKKKNDKLVALIASILIAAMVLVQHVHYTVDVVVAPVAAFISYRIAIYLQAKY
ncbi:hypothetical protein GALL_173060 [mine drainage metagenome]|uniref:Sphingomyelin synthase-like domain-containing protein n=1 Tax=mine drainage metagenome TaxID=410659 RepID=A0A1J5S984_9ZZZZ